MVVHVYIHPMVEHNCSKISNKPIDHDKCAREEYFKLFCISEPKNHPIDKVQTASKIK